jgi:hypothetical protein
MKSIIRSSLFVGVIMVLVSMATLASAEPYKGAEPPSGDLVLAHCKSAPSGRWVVTGYLGKAKDSGIDNCWLYYMTMRAARGPATSIDGFKLIRLDTGIWVVSKAMSKAVLQSAY